MLFRFPCRHLTIHRVLLLSHLLLVLALVGAMSYARYESEWTNKLRYFVDLSKGSFTPHLSDISALLAKQQYSKLTSAKILEHLNAVDKLKFLDISSGEQTTPVHIQFVRASEYLGIVDAGQPINIQAPHRWNASGLMETQYQLDKKTRALHLFLPLSNPGHGRIWAVFDAEVVMQYRHTLIQNLMLEAVSAVFLSMLVALYVTRRVVGPIKMLAKNMSASEQPSLELLPELARHDEIGQLAKAYKTLLTKNHEQLQQLQAQNDTDTLTGIGSRHKYSRVATDFIQHALKLQKCVGMFVCDIDYFKPYNDYYGHKEGDRALVAVAKGIQQTLSAGDMVFRFGGEEFLVLLARPKKSGLKYAGETLRENIEKLSIPHNAHEGCGVVTISIGGAYACLERMSLEELGTKTILDMLFEDADRSLYQSKKQGRNRFILSHQSIQ